MRSRMNQCVTGRYKLAEIQAPLEGALRYKLLAYYNWVDAGYPRAESYENVLKAIGSIDEGQAFDLAVVHKDNPGESYEAWHGELERLIRT